jgi:hypothetical protein
MVLSPVGLGTKGLCDGGGQQQFSIQSVFKGLIRSQHFSSRNEENAKSLWQDCGFQAETSEYKPGMPTTRLGCTFGQMATLISDILRVAISHKTWELSQLVRLVT